MAYRIKFEHPPAGYSLNSVKKGENAQVVFREFLTSEDGMTLIQRLEGFPSTVIEMLPAKARIKCSQVDHLLVHFDRVGNANIYINELSQIGLVRVRNDVKKGQAVYEDDIIDVEQLKFEGIDVPNEHGVLIIFSKGWRKGLYYDFEPIVHPDGKTRDYDLWIALGQCYNYLAFQELHSLTDEVWEALFSAKWFPFIGLRARTINELLAWVRSGHSADEVLTKAAEDVRNRLPSLRNRWLSSNIFAGHEEILNTAAERFEASDWVSANSILYPRIEGILRNIAKTTNAHSFSQGILANAPSNISALPHSSRILPQKFQRYLREVYFKNFDPHQPAALSRNSVSHGVAPHNEFSEKAAVLGFLIIEQLFYHIPPPTKQQLGQFGEERNNQI